MPVQISNLTKNYTAGAETTTALFIPALEIADGEQVALIGKSGGGKSTLLNIIAGIVTATSGSVKVNGTEITALSEAQRDRFRAEHIGYVFQTFNLIQGLTAAENVMLAMRFAGKSASAAGAAHRTRANDLLSRVGLGAKLNRLPRQLSVGEQQRVALARAIANEPRLLLADEPTANLDDENTDAVMTLLRSVSADANRMLLVVTHETAIAASLPRTIDFKTLSSPAPAAPNPPNTSSKLPV